MGDLFLALGERKWSEFFFLISFFPKDCFSSNITR